MVFIQLISSLFCAFMLLVIVGRARQCLDFSITLHFLHFLAVCFYNRTIPSNLSWLVFKCFL
uniref:Candidate secreted effector n=1 Tax=Meloidogyne incognita TaxID=6306 RepID=A0A914NLV0_MELIC